MGFNNTKFMKLFNIIHFIDTLLLEPEADPHMTSVPQLQNLYIYYIATIFSIFFNEKMSLMNKEK